MLGPVLVWLFQVAQQRRIAYFIFQLREGKSFWNLNWVDSVIGCVIISLEHYLDSGGFHPPPPPPLLPVKMVMACILSYLFQLLCPFCHVQRHHQRYCCLCLWKDGCIHWIPLFNIHSYKIVTTVQAGKKLVIKSLHHSYKSMLEFVNISGAIHHLRVCGTWGSQILGY
jgi:hypothetical protein